MGFDDVLELVLKDDRSEHIPIMYIVGMLMILDDHKIFRKDILQDEI